MTQTETDRIRCWIEFSEAAEASANGDHQKAIELVGKSPIVRTELRKFVEAIQEGRVVKIGVHSWKPQRKSSKPPQESVVDVQPVREIPYWD